MKSNSPVKSRKLPSLDTDKVRGGDRVMFLNLFRKPCLGIVLRRVKEHVEIVDSAKNRYALYVEDIVHRYRKSSWSQWPKKLQALPKSLK